MITQSMRMKALPLVALTFAVFVFPVISYADITPTSDLQLWLKADSIQNVTDGGAVSTWVDSSNYGRNATPYWQGVPTLMNNVMNGKPAVHFDGAQSLAVTDSPAWQLGNQYTIYVVAKRTPAWYPDDWWSGIVMGQDYGSAQPGKWAISFSGTQRNSFNIGGDGVAGGGVGFSLDYSQYGLFELHMDGSRFEGYSNGLLSAYSNNIPTAPPVDLARPLTIGYWETVYGWGGPYRQSGFGGDIAEIMIFNSAISDVRRQEVGGYLAEKYSLPSEYAPAPVPEPATMLLFGTGIAGLAAVGRRKRS